MISSPEKTGWRRDFVRDERIKKLARLLVDYSVAAGEGEQVLVTGGAAAEPLIKEVYARLLDVGAIPIPQVALPGLQELFFERARDLHYEKTPPVINSIYEGVDAIISIMAPHNTRALAGVDPRKHQALAKRDKAVQDLVLEKDRWALTLFPTQALAQESEMGLEEYEEFVFEAMALGEDDPVRYWREKAEEQGRLIKRLERAREVRIVGPGTDLALSIEGRKFLNGDGKHNMPCGEVFTGPVEDSANGEIYFGVPIAVAGREVLGVRLRFEEGRVVEASAEKGEEFLSSMLDADEGARYLGELLHDVVHLVRGVVGHVEIGGPRVVDLVRLGANVLVVKAQPVEGVADALHGGFAPDVRDPQHRLPLHDPGLLRPRSRSRGTRRPSL